MPRLPRLVNLFVHVQPCFFPTRSMHVHSIRLVMKLWSWQKIAIAISPVGLASRVSAPSPLAKTNHSPDRPLLLCHGAVDLSVKSSTNLFLPRGVGLINLWSYHDPNCPVLPPSELIPCDSSVLYHLCLTHLLNLQKSGI